MNKCGLPFTVYLTQVGRLIDLQRLNNRDTGSQAPLRVLVTRPEHQTRAFVLLLEQAGYEAETLPCIGIRPSPLDFDFLRCHELIGEVQNTGGGAAAASDDVTATELQLEHIDAVVFTSTNAVDSLVLQFPLPWKLGNCAILAVGPATAEKLETYGLKLAERPLPPYNSEALLKSATLCSNDLQKVVIVKGTGGRDFLQKSLEKLGVTVFTLNTYERFLPDIAESRLSRVFLKSPVDIVTITSNETLNNLALLAGTRYISLLLKLPLVVSSSRAAVLAKELGFQNTIAVAEAPGNLGLIETITNWKLSRDGI